MLRFISVILLLVGIGVAVLGGLALMEDNNVPRIGSGDEQSVTVAQTDTAPAPEATTDTKPTGARNGQPTFDTASSGKDTFSMAMAEEPPEEDQIFSTATRSMRAQQPSIMDKLRTVPIAHETPKAATFGKSFDVTLSIDATGDDSATDSLANTGRVVTGEAQLAGEAKALLSGTAFEIKLISDDVQTLSPLAENLWRWSVTPTQAGQHDLTIEIFAMDGDRVLPVRNYRDTVQVEVSRLGQAIAFAQQANPLAMLLGGIGSVLAGLIGTARFFGRGKG